ncbi:MAG: sensor histidine kinase [Bullifex sp.]
MLKGRFRHHFIRLFISIFALAAGIIALQLLFSYWSAKHAMNSWPTYVAEEYIRSIEEEMAAVENPTPDLMINKILDKANERISGLIFRDSEGLFQILYGVLPNGQRVRGSVEDPTLINTELKVRMYTTGGNTSTKQITTDVDVYEFNMDFNWDGTTEFHVSEDVKRERQTFTVPNEIMPRDIAATVVVRANGVIRGYYDILVMTARTYGPTRYIIDTSMLVLVVFIPIALIFALVASYVISRRNERSIKEIRGALQKLSHNDFDITLGVQKSSELQDIAASIGELGQNLERHQASRKEWIRSLSHDLNTPLASLNMLLDASMDGIFPLSQDLLKQMKKECDDLTGRISAIKYYAYLLSPDCTADKKETDAFDFLDSVVSTFADSSVFDVHVKDGDKLILDYTLASRALTEVLSNAVQAKGGKVTIKVSDGVIRVSNRGCLPDPLPDFFEPWSRGDISRHEGGAGLGLPIAGQIMRLHGGKATIRQEGENVVVDLDFRVQKSLEHQGY